MSLKDYIQEDAKNILMDVSEFAQPATYIKEDGTQILVTVREDTYENSLSNPTKLKGAFENVVADKRRFYFSSTFQPIVGDYIIIDNIKFKIIPPIKKDADLWVLTLIKSARKNGLRKT